MWKLPRSMPSKKPSSPSTMQSFNALGQCDWYSDPDSSLDDYFVPVHDKGVKKKWRVRTGKSQNAPGMNPLGSSTYLQLRPKVYIHLG